MKLIVFIGLVVFPALPALCQMPSTAPPSQTMERHAKQLEGLRELLDSPVAGHLVAQKKQRIAILRSVKTFSVDNTLLDSHDSAAASLRVFLFKSIYKVLGWKIVTMDSRPDCEIDILPYGGEYTDLANLSTHCSSAFGSMNCKSSSGATLSVNCDTIGCNGSSTGPRASYRVVIKGPEKKGLRWIVWKSNKGAAYQLKDQGRWLYELCTESRAGSKDECKHRVKQVMNGN